MARRWEEYGWFIPDPYRPYYRSYAYGADIHTAVLEKVTSNPNWFLRPVTFDAEHHTGSILLRKV